MPTPDIVTSIAADVAVIIEALTVEFTARGTSHTSSLRAYYWSQKDLDTPPGAVIQLPEIRRTGIDDPERQLGSRDYLLAFDIDFMVDIDDSVFAQAQALAAVEAFIYAIDEDPSLGATVDEAKVVSAGPPLVDQNATRPLLSYPAVLEVLKLTA